MDIRDIQQNAEQGLMKSTAFALEHHQRQLFHPLQRVNEHLQVDIQEIQWMMIWFQTVRLQVQTEKMEIMVGNWQSLDNCQGLRFCLGLQHCKLSGMEFDGVASMGTWDWPSVAAEEAEVKRRAIEKGETIHLADLLAIC